MRGKFILILIASCMLLSACVPSIETPRDEIRRFSWSYESDNGKNHFLSFDGTNADLDISYEAFDLEISGLCILTDDNMTILDDKTLVGYTFYYELYGDRVELEYDQKSIVLFKDNTG